MDKYQELKNQRDVFQAVTGIKLSRLNTMAPQVCALIAAANFAAKDEQSYYNNSVAKKLHDYWGNSEAKPLQALLATFNDESLSKDVRFGSALTLSMFYPAHSLGDVSTKIAAFLMDFFGSEPTKDIRGHESEVQDKATVSDTVEEAEDQSDEDDGPHESDHY